MYSTQKFGQIEYFTGQGKIFLDKKKPKTNKTITLNPQPLTLNPQNLKPKTYNLHCLVVTTKLKGPGLKVQGFGEGRLLG